MQVRFQESGELLIAQPHGRMDAAAGEAFVATVEQRVVPAARSVTIDLAGVDFLALGAIRAILRLARTLRANGSTLDFEGGGDAVRHALEQAGLRELFAFSPPLPLHRGHHHDHTP